MMILICIVIGRQGEMISKLQAESGARIQVAPGIAMKYVYLILSTDFHMNRWF